MTTATRKDRIFKSQYYRNGAFQNLLPTPVMIEGTSFLKGIRKFIKRPKTVVPPMKLPFIKTDLYHLDDTVPVIVWFGHSSYLISYQGFRVLVDPLLKSNASPVSFFGKPFAGSDEYGPADIPDIDMLIITHNHYDHLSYKTINVLKDRVTNFYTSLGVGNDLEKWGIPPDRITEFDWYERVEVNEHTSLTALPARHFSGRGIRRGRSLWSSFSLQLGAYRIYIGGDSGYSPHFVSIGEKYGPYGLAILECGQYGEDWPLIHMTPEETVQAARDLKAKLLLPVHWAKFNLSLHEWDEPIRRIVVAAEQKAVALAAPMIGEPFRLGEPAPCHQWWNE